MSTIVGPVTLPGLVTVLAQYDPERTWNGWLTPELDAWSAVLVLSELALYDPDDVAWAIDGDQIVTWDPKDPESVQHPDRYSPGPDGLYALGAFALTWEADPDTDPEDIGEVLTIHGRRETPAVP